MQTSFFNPEIFSLLGVLIFSGIITGLLSGLFGVGGGIILVPSLLYAFEKLGYSSEFSTHMAIGTSLAIIVPTSILSAWSHFKHGSINLKLYLKLSLPVSICALFGSWLAGNLSGDFLKLIFAVLIIIIALNLLRKRKRIIGKKLPSLPIVWIVVGSIGFFSAMMGIGGGAYFISFLTAYNTPLLVAVGTSASLGVMISLPAAIGYIFSGWNISHLPPLSFGYISLLGFIFIVPVTMAMAPQGTKLAHYLDKEKLKRFFAIFLIIMSLHMFYKIYT